MEKRSTSRLAEWLDRLARESWQLELIISGFAIFLLLGIYEPLQEMIQSINASNISWQLRNALVFPLMSLMAAWFILLINLCIHVVFRGLWISTIGLRSVSDDIDFEALNLRPRFQNFLQKRIGSFDRYIERLEQICSILFAFTFLILFMLLAIVGMITLMTLINWGLREGMGLGNALFVEIINIILLIGGFLYFIDFVSLARLKRISWLAPIYYPVYRFFSLVTLANLYRPLYYNLIDNRFGRRVGLLLVPYILFLMIASSVKIFTDAYYPISRNAINWGVIYYDDLRPEEDHSRYASIPSRYVDNGYAELFLPYNPNNDDESIKAVCPGLTPVKEKGVALEGVITISNYLPYNRDSLLQCMGAIHRVFVNDSLFHSPDFRFYTHPVRDDNGLLTILDVQYLPRGQHLLRVEKQRVGEDSLIWEAAAKIPFWKE